MDPEDTSLTSKYNLVKLSVRSSTQITKRVSAVISNLETTSTGGKAVIVALSAKSRVAGKLISIVEVAKRDLAGKGIKCFQYNALRSEMVEIDRTPRKAVANNDVGNTREVNDGSDSDDAFETLSTQPAGTKKRLVPVMTVYLSATSVSELKARYGYVSPVYLCEQSI